MTIRKLLIANRGEIAVRIIRAAQELGIAPCRSTARPTRTSLAVQAGRRGDRHRPAAGVEILSQHAMRSSPRPATTGADAIHPGYGFLAENADFADAVEAAGLDLRRADGARRSA